jgi:glycosyltransferase involved in cell wall biosynthesis
LHTLNHPEWARARAANAYRVVKDEYNWDRIARQTRELYDRIITARAKIDW